MFGFGGGGIDFGGLWDALSGLFTSGAGEAAVQGAGTAADTASTLGTIGSDVASGFGGAMNYPIELLGDVGGWLGNNWQPLVNTALQGAGTIGGLVNQGAQQSMMQKYLNQQQQSMLPQNIVQQATPDRPATSLVKRQLADAQAQGLSGAAPDFLARQTGFPNVNEFDLYRRGGF